jgi:spermidine synthase
MSQDIPPQRQRLSAFTVFLGSCLLFGVQPMLGRTLLPPFGGTAAVWTVCLAAYQVLLLAGYFYAHVISRRPLRVQRAAHSALLVLGVVWTAAFAFLRPTLKDYMGNSGVPALEVLFCVLVYVGLPYVLLSAGSTLVQAWLARSGDGEKVAGGGTASRGVYKFYAISNIGSFAGLLVYPFVLEPYVSLTAQWLGFAAGLAVYTALLWRMSNAFPTGDGQPTTDEVGSAGVLARNNATLSAPSISSGDARLWFALPALSSFALVATTNRLTLETTPMPLFWVLLLSAFLLSYVVGFSEWGERYLPPLLFAALISCVGAGVAQRLDAATAFEWILLSGVAFLFFGGALLHGWLHASRPGTERLTTFYLGIAAGGATGGVTGSLLPPVLFKTVFEFPLAILLVAAACGVFAQSGGMNQSVRRAVYGLAALAVVCGALCRQTHPEGCEVVTRERNFYGTLRVERKVLKSQFGSEQPIHYFKHGNTMHGVQFRDTGLSQNPTAYFGEHAGGFPILSHPKRQARQPMRVGVVGLGVGVLANYGQKGDVYRFYEINPQVVGIATNPALFSFMSDCQARVEIVEGDARKRLEEERARNEEKFDVLIVDIFSGDSIATHIISAEAFDLYKDRLAEDGIFSIHISNWHIDLFPVCKAVAKRWGTNVVGVVARADEVRGEILSFWSSFSKEPLPPISEKCREVDFAQVKDVPLITDEKGSLLNLIRFFEPPPVKPRVQ